MTDADRWVKEADEQGKQRPRTGELWRYIDSEGGELFVTVVAGYDLADANPMHVVMCMWLNSNMTNLYAPGEICTTALRDFPSSRQGLRWIRWEKLS